MPVNLSQFPEIYSQPLESLSEKYIILCFCLHCGWMESSNLNEIDFCCLEELKDDMECPECFQKGLSISLVPVSSLKNKQY